MSSIANGTYASLGLPMVKAGQKGHSCLMRYSVDGGGKFAASIQQSATGGPSTTWACWLFGDGPTLRSQKPHMPFAGYQYGPAQAMNV